MGRYEIEINTHKMTNFPKLAIWGTLFQTERERERAGGERQGRYESEINNHEMTFFSKFAV